MILPILLACMAIDGDTIRCSSERIRITAIDAPELHGCRKGRDCAPGDPFASKSAMAGYLTKPLTIERLGVDRYGRTVADVYSAGRSVSCLQMAGGFARYWRRYDTGGRIRRECGLSNSSGTQGGR